MKLMERDRKELKLETLCGHLDPAVPEAHISLGILNLHEPINSHLLHKLVCSWFSDIYNQKS